MSAAKKWMQKAASAGDPEAQFGMGRICLQLDERDEAIDWFERAAKQEFLPAIYRLAADVLANGSADRERRMAAIGAIQHASGRGHLRSEREYALAHLRGEFGVFDRLRGFVLYLRFFVAVVVQALRDPKSERFLY